ncbi:MAG TPA: Ig-like domain-containing protein [Vicinamibacteria bacterium]|nr:Ig-like domain-containing protein [Vicinamibacteria bacterium]
MGHGIKGRGIVPRFFVLALLCVNRASAQDEPLVFSVIGDVPYSASEKSDLEQHLLNHNLFSTAELFVHLGDIKSGASACIEARYEDVAVLLDTLAVPTFIVPGDNEWTDCADPGEAWAFWEAHFLRLEQNYCGTPPVSVQPIRPENFAFAKSGVLFVGINKVGGVGIGLEERTARLQDDADWVTQQFEAHASAVRAAVVLAQASPLGSPFVGAFRAAAAAFAKPVLYIHGDGHSWIDDQPFPEQNIRRVQVERGTLAAPPVQVTVTTGSPADFLVNRDPWPPGSLPFNRGPCVDAGPDLTAIVGEETELEGMATDDGVPLAGSLTVSWTQISGPDIAMLDEPSSPTTDAFFGTEGVYVLRLTADDGELFATDTVSINVVPGNTSPSVSITSPANGSIFVEAETVTITGIASDAEDGDLTASISWASNRDGVIGSGGSVATTWLSAGTHAITAAVTDSGGLTTNDTIGIVILAAPPSNGVNVAIDDFRTLQGTVGGSYALTHELDGVHETLTESGTSTGALDHTWIFNVSPGAIYSFVIRAFHTPSPDGDSFAFYYSKDDLSYSYMLTVTTTVSGGLPQTFLFGEDISGPLFIRVVDTNASPGNGSLDTLYVDHMVILSSNDPIDITPPGPPTGLTVARGNTLVSLDWDDNLETDLTSYRVYRANVPEGPYSDIGVGPVLQSAYDDSSAANGVTYYYYVTAVDTYGNESSASSPAQTPCMDVLFLTDQTFTNTAIFDACTTVSAGANFNVLSPADITFRAGHSVVLSNGFSVGPGALFKAMILQEGN